MAVPARSQPQPQGCHAAPGAAEAQAELGTRCGDGLPVVVGARRRTTAPRRRPTPTRGSRPRRCPGRARSRISAGGSSPTASTASMRTVQPAAVARRPGEERHRPRTRQGRRLGAGGPSAACTMWRRPAGRTGRRRRAAARRTRARRTSLRYERAGRRGGPRAAAPRRLGVDGEVVEVGAGHELVQRVRRRRGARHAGGQERLARRRPSPGPCGCSSRNTEQRRGLEQRQHVPAGAGLQVAGVVLADVQVPSSNVHHHEAPSCTTSQRGRRHAPRARAAAARSRTHRARPRAPGPASSAIAAVRRPARRRAPRRPWRGPAARRGARARRCGSGLPTRGRGARAAGRRDRDTGRAMLLARRRCARRSGRRPAGRLLPSARCASAAPTWPPPACSPAP